MATARATPRPASARPGQGTAGRAAAALLAVALPAAGTAQPAAAGVETRSLYAAPGWAVVLGHDTDDGTLWCAAETANRRDQALHLMMLGDGRAVFAASPVSGTYDLAITSRMGGGRATIRQSGDFTARPGTPALLGETEMLGAPANHAVDLQVRIGPQRLTCASPA